MRCISQWGQNQFELEFNLYILAPTILWENFQRFSFFWWILNSKSWGAKNTYQFIVTVICSSPRLSWAPTWGWMSTFLCSEVRKSQNTPLSWNSSQFHYWADKYYSHRLDFKNNFVPGYNSGCGVENWTNYKNSLIFLTTTPLVCKNKKGKKNKRTFWTHLNLMSWFDEESLFFLFLAALFVTFIVVCQALHLN